MRLRRAFVLGLLIAAATSLLSRPAHPSEKPQPSVIIVLVDALRADYLGCYGFIAPTSPSIDAFSKKCVFFENCATAAPWTKPSVASLFTSVHPETHRLIHATMKGDWPNHIEVLPSTFTTMAELFQQNGYRTIALNCNPWIAPESGLMQGFDQYIAFNRDRFAGDVCDWISTYTTTAPTFMYVHFLDVHGHYLFSEENYYRMARALKVLPGADTKFDNSHLAWYMKATFQTHPEREKSVLSWRAAYAAGVARFDGLFQNFLEQLHRTGLWDRSIVIFISDHGEGLMDHGWLEHGNTLNLEEVHVPFLIHFPQDKYAGVRVRDWVSLVDILPTLADYCHLGRPNPVWQGRSLVEQIGRGTKVNRSVFTSAMKGNDDAKSVIEGIWHYISMGQNGPADELYNLTYDRPERRSVVGQRTGVIAHCRKLLNTYLDLQKKASANVKNESAPMTDEMKEELRSLGYLQ